MSETEFAKIVSLLDAADAKYEVFEHEAVRTSEEAAAVRGSALKEGVKALLVKFKRKGKEFYAVLDIPADRKLDFAKAQKVLQAEGEVKFAKLEEVEEKTGCEAGGVPPLGHKNKLALLVDPRIFENEQLEFNAGLKTKSVRVEASGLKKAFEQAGAAFFELAE